MRIGSYQETGNFVILADVAQLGLHPAALGFGHEAAGVKGTAGRRIQGAGHFTL